MQRKPRAPSGQEESRGSHLLGYHSGVGHCIGPRQTSTLDRPHRQVT